MQNRRTSCRGLVKADSWAPQEAPTHGSVQGLEPVFLVLLPGVGWGICGECSPVCCVVSRVPQNALHQVPLKVWAVPWGIGVGEREVS